MLDDEQGVKNRVDIYNMFHILGTVIFYILLGKANSLGIHVTLYNS